MNANPTTTEMTRTYAVAVINLDASNAARIISEALPLLDDARPLILDLSTVQFADSSGLGALCSLAKQSRAGQLSLKGVSDRLGRVLARVPALEELRRERPRLSVLTA